MEAMFDSFLGEDFDSSKRDKVIGLQQNLHRGQNLLAKQLESGVISNIDYVDSFNKLTSTIFEACEAILGTADFENLFGAPRAEMQGYIDKDKFLASSSPSSSNEVGVDDLLEAPHHRLFIPMVLIVDDSEKYRIKLHGALQSAGCRVLQAENGWAALEMLNNHQPDVMLLDIKMSTMSGYELVEIVHRRPKTAKMRVFMLASKVTATTRAEAASVGASSVFVKSGQPEELVSKINSSFNH